MIGIIVLIDQMIWRPVIAWAEKFKFEQVESADAPQSPVLDLLRSSRILPFVARFTVRPAREALSLHFARNACFGERGRRGARDSSSGSRVLLLVALLVGIVYAFVQNGFAACAPHALGTEKHFSRRGRDISARGVHIVACRAVDDSRWAC